MVGTPLRWHDIGSECLTYSLQLFSLSSLEHGLFKELTWELSATLPVQKKVISETCNIQILCPSKYMGFQKKILNLFCV